MVQFYPTLLKRSASLILLTGCIFIVGVAATSCTAPVENTPTQPAATQPYEQRLAQHLTAQDAKMYGAFWCPHCADQKALFGEFSEEIPYVECDPEGENSQSQLCREKDIQGYPTWEISGEFYPGTRSLEELAQLSGFKE